MTEQKRSVQVAILTLGEREGWLHPSLGTFIVSLTHERGRQLALQIRTDHKPTDYARNCVVRDFLTSSCTWLLQIDNDMQVPLNILEMIDRAEGHMDILVPKFFKGPDRAPEGGMALMLCWELLGSELGADQWCELALAGTGVMAVHRRVFERLGNEGWFRFSYDADGKLTNSEDFAFCQKARRAGFRIWGNQLFEANHFKTMPLSAVARGVSVILPTVHAGLHGLEVPHSKAAAQS